MNCQIYNDDCIPVMTKMVKNGVTVDLTVTSPPYDDLRTYESTLVWNFEVFKKIANLLYEITAEGGVVVWIVSDRTKKGSETLTSFKQALYFKEIGFNVHDTMIYAKNNPIPLTHRRYEQQFEYMFVFSKGKLKTFNPIKIPCEYHGTYKGNRKFRAIGGKQENAHKQGNVKKDKIKFNIWNYSVGSGNTTEDKIAFKHPAVFPEQLANDHILSWSNIGDTVFDPLMGSGTVGKMALINDRNFIGIEKVEKYFFIVEERLRNLNRDVLIIRR